MSDAVEPPPPRSRRGGGLSDIVVSMVVLLGVVALLLLLAPQPGPIVQPGVDPVAAAREAQGLDFEAAAAPATRLGDGWVASYARVEDQQGVTQWRVGYLSPADRRVDLEQATGVTWQWLTRGTVAPPGADEDPLQSLRESGEQVPLAGATWIAVSRADGRRAYALIHGEGADALVTVLSTSSAAGLPDLQAVAEALGPLRSAGQPTSASAGGSVAST